MPITIDQQIRQAVAQALDQALAILKKNLATYPPFDSKGPYEDKDKYFNQLVGLSDPLLREDIRVPAVEQYYRLMKDTIEEHERQTGTVFNKGIVYANLGIILTAQGNLDEGIHLLLMANKEDAAFRSGPLDHGVINDRLWKENFEDRHVISRLTQLNTNNNAGLLFVVDEAFILGFLRTLELPERLFLEATIWTVYRNLEFNQKNSNDYTRGRLFSGLKDLCLMTEALLRKKQMAGGTVPPNTQIMLNALLTNALSSVGIVYPPNPALPVHANSLQAFVDNLEQILNTSPNAEIRRMCCLHLVRNFTGHHFDVAAHVVSANGNEFFTLYEATLTNIVSAILYLAHESLI